ncbi:MAG: dodecin family protein [Gammaproteobacteria bacterium]
MAIAKVSEITSSSKQSFEHAVTEGIARASKTIDNIRGAWINEQNVVIKDGKVVEWRVNMRLTFVLND